MDEWRDSNIQIVVKFLVLIISLPLTVEQFIWFNAAVTIIAMPEKKGFVAQFFFFFLRFLSSKRDYHYLSFSKKKKEKKSMWFLSFTLIAAEKGTMSLFQIYPEIQDLDIVIGGHVARAMNEHTHTHTKICRTTAATTKFQTKAKQWFVFCYV